MTHDVKVLIAFFDTEANKKHNPNDIIKVSDKRLSDFNTFTEKTGKKLVEVVKSITKPIKNDTNESESVEPTKEVSGEAIDTSTGENKEVGKAKGKSKK